MRVARMAAAVAVVGVVSGCGLLDLLPRGQPEEEPAPAAPGGVRSEEPVAEAAIVATMRLLRSRRFLPAELETRDLVLEIDERVGIEELAGRLADVLAVDVAVEDRPARDGRPVEMGEAVPMRVDERGKVREVLDVLGSRMGYEWEYTEASEGSRVVFYRHIDARWQERLARMAVEDREEPEAAADVWRIDPVRHETVRGVLEDWAEVAGWTVVWEAEDLDYAVTANAAFHGSFEEAVDGLLRDTRGYRALIPTAWRSNRYLTVRVGG